MHGALVEGVGAVEKLPEEALVTCSREEQVKAPGYGPCRDLYLFPPKGGGTGNRSHDPFPGTGGEQVGTGHREGLVTPLEGMGEGWRTPSKSPTPFGLSLATPLSPNVARVTSDALMTSPRIVTSI